MTKLFLLIAGCFLCIQATYAQNKWAGQVFENKTNVPIAGIKIENLKTHNSWVSDAFGKFAIKASVGDNICFSGFSYQPDTIYLTDLKYTEIFLDVKRTMLNEVKVVTPEIKTGSLTAAPAPSPFGGQTLVYQTDGAGNPIGGLTLRVFDYDNDKKKRKDHQLVVDEEKELKISNVFNAKNLANYLPVRGVEMDNFVVLYRPDAETFFSASFNLAVYLNACYKKFLDIPEKDRQSPTYLQLIMKHN